MGLKQILIDAKTKIENEMNTSINNVVASVLANDVQPKLAELEASKSSAVKEKSDEIASQIQALKTQLSAEITSLNEQCEAAKQAYKDQKVTEATDLVKANYTVELNKLEDQINSLTEEF